MNEEECVNPTPCPSTPKPILDFTDPAPASELKWDWETVCLSNDGGVTKLPGIAVYSMLDPQNPSSTLYIGTTDVTATHTIVSCDLDRETVESCYQLISDPSVRFKRINILDVSVTPAVVIETIWLDDNGDSVAAPAGVEPCSDEVKSVESVCDVVSATITGDITYTITGAEVALSDLTTLTFTNDTVRYFWTDFGNGFSDVGPLPSAIYNDGHYEIKTYAVMRSGNKLLIATKEIDVVGGVITVTGANPQPVANNYPISVGTAKQEYSGSTPVGTPKNPDGSDYTVQGTLAWNCPAIIDDLEDNGEWNPDKVQVTGIASQIVCDVLEESTTPFSVSPNASANLLGGLTDFDNLSTITAITPPPFTYTVPTDAVGTQDGYGFVYSNSTLTANHLVDRVTFDLTIDVASGNTTDMVQDAIGGGVYDSTGTAIPGTLNVTAPVIVGGSNAYVALGFGAAVGTTYSVEFIPTAPHPGNDLLVFIGSDDFDAGSVVPAQYTVNSVSIEGNLAVTGAKTPIKQIETVDSLGQKVTSFIDLLGDPYTVVGTVQPCDMYGDALAEIISLLQPSPVVDPILLPGGAIIVNTAALAVIAPTNTRSFSVKPLIIDSNATALTVTPLYDISFDNGTTWLLNIDGGDTNGEGNRYRTSITNVRIRPSLIVPNQRVYIKWDEA